MIIVQQANPLDPPGTALLDASQALMRKLFNPEDNHFLSHDALAQPDVRFYVARRGDDHIGCGALKICDGYGEIKSFFVTEQARGHGVGAAILRQIEDQARTESLPALKLETGDTLTAAQRLYTRHGFTICGPFGDYDDFPRSVFMEKPLTD